MGIKLSQRRMYSASLFAIGVLFLTARFADKHVTLESPQISSQNKVVGNDQMRKICESWLQYTGELIIQGEVQFQRNDKWQNVFQTADLNYGIRMEISPQSTVSVVVAESVSQSYGGYEIGEIEPSQNFFESFKFAIRLTRNHMRTELNGKYRNFALAENIQCSNVVIGGGYDETRTLNGNTQIFISAKYSTRRYTGFSQDLLFYMGQISVCFSVLVVAFRDEEMD